MKKLLTGLTLALSFAVSAVTIERDANIGTSKEHAIVAAELINAFGYRCNSVSSIRGALRGGGHIVHCNNYRYQYHIVDIGGRWTVKVL